MPAILITAIFLALLAAPAPAAAAAHEERRLVSLIAADRAANGLPPLRVSLRLARLSERHAARLVRANRLWHRPGPVLLRTARATWTGEVLADAPSPERALSMWLRSPPHRAVVRARHARVIGVAIRGDVFVAHLAGRRG